MLRDLIVEEVRRVRHEIEAECEDDPQRYYDHIQQVHEQYRTRRLVQRKPKPALKRQKLAV